MSPPHRVLILSLGNPGKYRFTYHSAGHIVLEALRKQLDPTLPGFTQVKYGKKPAVASLGRRYSLVQSPVSMNVSGDWVAAAVRQHFDDNLLSSGEGAVVLVHDELELGMGEVKIRQWDSSHKGHNGVKSVQRARIFSKQDNDDKFVRVSVGIGRPEERDKDTVSNYVLSPVSGHDKSILQGASTMGVLDAIINLERRWKGE